MLRQIELSKIDRNPDQPRQTFCPKAMDDLARSIDAQGLKQAITIRPKGDGRYEIVMGERRFRAHQILERETVLSHVKRMDDDDAALAAITENLAREDISPMEEARAYQRMIDSGYTPASLAKALGLKPAFRVKWRLALLKLEPEIQTLVDQEAISLNAARMIADVSASDQTQLVRQIGAGRLRTDNQVSVAVEAIKARDAQIEIPSPDQRPAATAADVRTIARMEAQIETVCQMVAAGFRDGECVVAKSVSPDRAQLMADKLKALQGSVRLMVKQLETAAVQGEMAVAAE